MNVLTEGGGGATVDREGPLSPFAGLTTYPVAEAAAETEGPGSAALESPFGAGLVSEALDRTDEAAAGFFEALADEDFADAVERLVDEAAAQHLAEHGAWSGMLSEPEALAALERWIEPLAAESERALDGLAEGLAGVDLTGMDEQELGGFLASAGGSGEVPPLGSEGFEQFLGGLVRKAKSVVKGVVGLAKKGIKAIGSVLPIGPVLDKLKALVRPLLSRVLRAATNRLPAAVRPIARTLAAKLGLGETGDTEDGAVATLAEEFDARLTGLLFAPGSGLESEVAGEEESEAGDRIGELDAARERLAGQLTELPAGTRPVAEIEQFIPAVMAARPLVKLGISLIGREKVVRFVADRIAGLIKGLVGPEAARTVSRPIVDLGFRSLGLEVTADQEQALAGEALASAVEATVERVLELPAEAFEDELQLDAAVQQAFAEAAAAAMPDRLLRADLPERETAGEGGVWVLMPRAARPRYRFRRYTRVYVVPVSRQLARSVPWSDGGTLESHLLDRGAERWPVEARVDLYEALPGTHLGHLTQDEAARGGDRPDAGEYQPLTPEIAGLLLGEPGLGRRLPYGAAALGGRLRPAPGRRYFRLRPVALPATGRAHPRRRRVLVTLHPTTGRLNVALRLSERQAQELLARLTAKAPGGRPDLPSVLAGLRALYAAVLPPVLVGRLLRSAVVADAAAAGRIADRVTAAVTGALSAFLAQHAAQLAAAVRDPADGVTLTFAFSGAGREALTGGALPPAKVTVGPGWHRHA